MRSYTSQLVSRWKYNEGELNMKWKLFVFILSLVIISCSDTGTSPEGRDLNFKFSYGVGGKNVLNTFDNTYTKDLIIDGTITVPFSLSESDFQQIITKMLQIDFFSYPDTFLISTGDTVCYITPHSTYNFEVNYKSNIKHLYWSDSIVSQDSSAVKLREFINLIVDIIQSNPMYSHLPPARAGYL